MPPMPHPFDYSLDANALFGLRDCVAHLAATGFSETVVREHLGLKDLSDLQMRALPIYRKERLFKRTPLDIAIDLFLLQGVIAEAELSQLLKQKAIDVLLSIGILTADNNNSVRASVSLFPVGQRLLFSDHAWPQLSESEDFVVPFGQVMFIGIDSRWLARATVRRSVSSALDLCTGSGIHALLASFHAKRAVAVDINSRAVKCTRFNAQVLGCSNLEAFEGDLYGPLGDETFDLITANPPFVPAPKDTLGFRDGGHSGEEVQRRIVADLPKYLAKGGIAQIVTEIGEREGEPIVNRVREWLGDAPMDIHLLRIRIHSAESYALGHASGDTPEEFLSCVDAWASNLKTQGFTRVISVLLAFEWSDPSCGVPWNRVDEAYPPSREAGGEIEAAFFAERTVRHQFFRTNLNKWQLVRTGPIILQEGRVLGSDLPATCQAVLSGQALSVECQLNPVERDVLASLNEPVGFEVLLNIAREIGVQESTLFDSVVSLIRKRLVKLECS